ncbi:MAG: prenyltransferase/squalene oxidase repeat-containing protein, partial [Elusimicrobiota bacterium]
MLKETKTYGPMMRRLAAEWLTPFGHPLFRKPSQWAERFKPAAGSEAEGEVPPVLEQGSGLARAALLRKQNAEDGYWSADLRADTTLESDTIMLLHFLGRGDSPKIRRLANFILDQQNADGGWPIFRGGPSEISASVKAYWALKLAGHSPEEACLSRARKRISELGGIHRVNTYSKFYMALFGLYDWRGVPSIPPEIMLFPTWFYFNLYELSAWTRSIVVPLSVIWSERPKAVCPAHARLDAQGLPVAVRPD